MSLVLKKRFRTEPVSPGTCRDNLPGCTKMYVGKYTITYASFRIQTNQICIIVSTEVLPYPRTSPGKICVMRVVLSDEMSRENVPGNIPQDTSRGKTSTPTILKTPTHKLMTEKSSQRNCLTIIAAPSGIISLFHHFTIGENGKVKR